ncbi:MAG: response regulator [Deltaproteobacteria bacterium]|nr:response regulator [Deltaproteobacteria bacterium]
MASDAENHLRITVTDHGLGCDPDVVREKAKAGQGFGLFSIRERLEMMDGRFEIKSSPGNGAVFSLTVPVDTGPEEREIRVREVIANFKREKTGDSIRVLLVDGHTVVRQGPSTMLTLHSDIDIVGEAADRMEAIEKTREVEPDVILMDISMPKMDGIEATKIIHSELPYIRIIGRSMHKRKPALKTRPLQKPLQSAILVKMRYNREACK